MKTKLYISLYPEKNVQRREELFYCLTANLRNKLIDEVHILIDKKLTTQDLPGLEGFVSKVYFHFIDKNRPNFTDFIELMQRDAFGMENHQTLFIIANSDIIIPEETIQKAFDKLTYGKVFALSRHDFNPLTEQSTHLNRRDSQDTWMFKDVHTLRLKAFEFPIGAPGCDNRIAQVFADHNLSVSNPSIDLLTYHVHQSQVLNYRSDGTKTVEGPYMLLNPITLAEC
jgi:hypothetical protein